MEFMTLSLPLLIVAYHREWGGADVSFDERTKICRGTGYIERLGKDKTNRLSSPLSYGHIVHVAPDIFCFIPRSSRYAPQADNIFRVRRHSLASTNQH